MALLEKLMFMSSLFAVKGTRVTGWGGGEAVKNIHEHTAWMKACDYYVANYT